MSSGRGLIVCVGPSGSGKDSLIAWLNEHAPAAINILVAPRYCTRTDPSGLAHLPCSEQEFRRRLDLGCFALHWQANQLHYGIGMEIEDWLKRGATVLVNGSRSSLPALLQRYPEAGILHLYAQPETLAQRLQQRQRESAAEIAARLARQPALPQHLHLRELSNDGSLSACGQQAVQLLHELRASYEEVSQS